MIRITVSYQENKFQSLIIKGHAYCGEHGQDVVCAGVSSIFIGGLNNLNDPNCLDIEIKEGDSSVLLKKGKTLTTHDEVVMETIITSLKTIAEEFPKNVVISEN